MLQQIHHLQVISNHIAESLLAGLYRSVFRGQGMEFEQVREYSPGDEVRSIDWNVTARMSNPYIKQFREERNTIVYLVVDRSASLKFGSQPISKAHSLGELAALIAFAAVRNGDRVGLMLFDSEVKKHIRPKQGLKQAMRITREICADNFSGNASDMTAVVKTLLSTLAHRSICFVLTDLLFAPPMRLLSQLNKRHELVFGLVEDTLEKSWPLQSGVASFRDLESGKIGLYDFSLKDRRGEPAARLKLMQKQNREALDKAAIDSFCIEAGQSAAIALEKFLHFKRLHRG